MAQNKTPFWSHVEDDRLPNGHRENDRKPTSFGKNGLRETAGGVLPFCLPSKVTTIGKLHVLHRSNIFFSMPLPVGAKAPDFTLKTKTAEGLKDIRLSDNFGKYATVLLFFPLAFTSVCTREMCDTTAGLGVYEKLGARVIAISVDSPYAQEAWAVANKINLTMVSDLNKTVIKAYEVVYSMPSGLGDTAARAAFVIGADGLIKYSEQTATTKDLPNFAAIQAVLAT